MELISSGIFGAIVLLLVFFYFKIFSNSPKPKDNTLKTPPEAGGAKPFIGHLQLMSGGDTNEQLPHYRLAAVAEKHGPIFTIRLGVHRAVVVSDWELAKELFTKCDVAISNRPLLRATKYLGHNLAMFGFTPYGAYWREMRKLVSIELLSSQRVELQRNVRMSETVQSINELYKVWDEKKANGSGSRVRVDMKQWFGNLNLNVILRLVAGKRFVGGSAEGGDAAITLQCRKVFRDLFHLSGLFVPADALPYLGWLDIGGYEKKMRETAVELNRIVGGWLKEHKEKEKSANYKPQDFMDVMISVLEGAKFQSQYSNDTIIKASCEALIAGGSDTTSGMLVWTLSLIMNHPSVLKKVQEELDLKVGRERRVNESDINNLVYLNAIVKETLRLYPAGALGGPREFTADTNVAGYHIPKGTWLIPNLWKMQRDPKVWSDDALEFKPERFLGKHKDLDVKGQDFELIPFGAGRRICPGTNFGLQMLHVVLANLLQGFDLSRVSDEMIDMTESAGLTNSKATPLDLLVSPRLSPSLYC